MNLHNCGEELKEQWERFSQTVDKPSTCLFCQGSRIQWNGHRIRTASVLIGDQVKYLNDIPCRRVKCGQCHQSWTLRPPGLMPRRHYQLCVVANATSRFLLGPHATLTLVAQAHCCCRRTVGRWLHWVGGVADPSRLIRRLFRVSKQRNFTTAFQVSDILRRARNTGKMIFRHTAQILGLLDALAMAYGYEPPGLGTMVEAAIYNRDRVTTYRSPFIPELAR